MAVVARTTLAAEALTESIRRELASIDPDIPVYGVQTMKSYLAQNTEQPRLSVMLLAGLGGLALLLAVIGIYGVVSYSVAQRTQEIGVRMALGATRRHVMRLVVGQATALVVMGVVLGLGVVARAGVRHPHDAVRGFRTRSGDARGHRGWPDGRRRPGERAARAPGDAGRSDRGAAGGVREEPRAANWPPSGRLSEGSCLRW